MVESHQRRHLKADKTIAGQPGRQEFSTRAPQRSRIPSVLGSLARIVRLRSRLEVAFVGLTVARLVIPLLLFCFLEKTPRDPTQQVPQDKHHLRSPRKIYLSKYLK